MLGAGGSARAAVWALLDAGAREVRVWNRTPERAQRLCAEIGGIPVAGGEPADLLVNCTSSGLDGSSSTFKELPLHADELSGYRCVVDLVYTDSETALVQAARGPALPSSTGSTLLVGQGALSFERFTGRAAPIETMRRCARNMSERHRICTRSARRCWSPSPSPRRRPASRRRAAAVAPAGS